MTKLYILFFLCLIETSKAQTFLGLANSNYAGTNGIYSNPANIADSRHGFYFNLMTLDANLSNNYYAWNSSKGIIPFIKDGDKFNSLFLKSNEKGKLFNIGTDIRLPSFLFRVNKRNSFAITSRARIMVNANNVSANIFELAKDELSESEKNISFNNSTLNLNLNAFTEIGFSYARVWLDKDKHFLKGGFSLKYLLGIYSANILVENMAYTLEDRVNNGSTETVLQIDNLKGKIGFSNEKAFENYELEEFFPWKNPQGKGLGFDVGFVYEYRPQFADYSYSMDGKTKTLNRKNKYKYRLGISLIDIGSIRYQDNARLYDFNIQNKALTENDLEGITDPADFVEKLGVDVNDYQKSMRAGLPTTLHLNFDYRLSRKLYANLSVSQNLRGKNAIGTRQASLASITPRFETGYFEFAIPLSLINNYSKFAFGAFLKLGPWFIGSDNIAGAINLGDPHGANIYTGLNIAIINKKPKKDSDGDGVSDKKDACPDEAGSSECGGCSDKDGDGVPDKDDACPDEFGKKELKGCNQ